MPAKDNPCSVCKYRNARWRNVNGWRRWMCEQCAVSAQPDYRGGY
jgi:hypothetical protein